MPEEQRRKIIIFVRHGQSESNVLHVISSAVDEYPLTERGMAQAREAAEEIATLPRVDSIYCSPVMRARQTAVIISKRIGMTPIIDERLRERSFGTVEGKPEPENSEWKFDPQYMVDPWEGLKKKMISFIHDARGEVIVAVSHGDNLSAVCDFIDNKGERFHAPRCPRNCHFVIIESSKAELIAMDVDRISEEIIERMQGKSNQ